MKKPDIDRNRPLGLYLHIPFCKAKCAYCDFYSLAHSEEKMDAYAAALTRHITEVAPQMQNHRVDTVYFGGGTPSYLGHKRLIALLKTVKKQCRVWDRAEITLEANPDSAGDWRLASRVISARSHTLAACRKAGLDNISLDLIYGLPDQTMERWENTLADALVLAPRHISCYGLKLEEGTPLYARRDSLTLPDGDMQADMYLYAVELLGQNGYAQYEISNFAQPGYESRHNLKYWTLGEYAGFGPGAHSDFGGVRYGYTRDLDGYLAGRLDLAESETISAQEREMEYIMLRLRTVQGIDTREFESRFRQRFGPLDAILDTCAAHGLAQRTDTGWRLTPKGFLVSNRIIGDLQEELHREKAQRLARAARGDYRVLE